MESDLPCDRAKQISPSRTAPHPASATARSGPSRSVIRSPAILPIAGTAPDLRILLGMAEAGMGGTVLPDSSARRRWPSDRLTERPSDRTGPVNTPFRAWTRAALRDARRARSRDVLLRRFRTA